MTVLEQTTTATAPVRSAPAALRGRTLSLVALLLATLNLRPAITTMAAVLEDAGRHFALDGLQLLLLSMLPVLAFGATAPLAGVLARRIGVERTMGWALTALGAALVARVLAGPLLLPATFASGAAIMVVSVLVPQALKQYGANGWWTGLASVGFGVGAALGAGLIRPLQGLAGGSLETALALWSVPALAAAALVFLAASRNRQGPAPAPAGSNRGAVSASGPGTLRVLLAQPVAVALMFYFGLQALMYFSVTAWLPSLLVGRGATPADAALMLAWFSVAGVVPTFLMPVLASRPGWLRILPAAIGVAVLAGFLWLMVADGPSLFAVVGFLGAAESAAFGMAVALVVLRSADPATAGAMSALSQGGGFALAAGGPALIGGLHQMTGDWALPVLLLAGFAALLVVAGAAAVRGQQVRS
ncbi:MFS transporter [Arthrobacter sp. 35W]|uniref:MFS transporter n=1 Tax=Arthrobacter sp. 35W TaxID=1132441 RepID=UPI0004188DB8|nr:MFS transporter [Arthrobacter sp. 35W]